MKTIPKSLPTHALLLLLALVPACGRTHEDREEAKKPRKKTSQKLAQILKKPSTIFTAPIKTARSLFSDDVEGFVLEEVNTNPFSQSPQPAKPATARLAQAAATAIEALPKAAAELTWTEDQEGPGHFKTIYFDFDRDNIRPDQRTTLAYDQHLAKQVATDKKEVIVAEGHASLEGAKTYNLALSGRRAEQVRKELVKAGIPADQIVTVPRGTDMPIVSKGDRLAQAKNRRVELYSVARAA